MGLGGERRDRLVARRNMHRRNPAPGVPKKKEKSPDVLLAGKRSRRPTRGIDFSSPTKMSGRSQFSSDRKYGKGSSERRLFPFEDFLFLYIFYFLDFNFRFSIAIHETIFIK